MLARTLSFFCLFLLPFTLFADEPTTFRTPDWATAAPQDYHPMVFPAELNPKLKTTVTPECVILDATELKEAVWVRREDVTGQPNDFSLTNEMMLVFRDGREPR